MMGHSWLLHLIVGAIVKGVIYSAAWHIMRGLPILDDIIIVAVVVTGGWLFFGRTWRTTRW